MRTDSKGAKEEGGCQGRYRVSRCPGVARCAVIGRVVQNVFHAIDTAGFLQLIFDMIQLGIVMLDTRLFNIDKCAACFLSRP